MRGAVMAVLRYVDARMWKELYALLGRNRNYEKRRNENEEK
jgi:hypothetical protein